MRYLRSALDDLLDEVFPEVPATAIEGAETVGKTETARRRVQRVLELDSCLARIVNRDLAEEGLMLRRPPGLDGLASYTAILDAATSGQIDKPSRRTTENHRNLLSRIWVLDPVPGWTSSLSPLARLKVGPKHQLLDPALAARLLDLSPAKLLSGAPGSGEVLGQLFESLVTLCVRVPSAVAGLQVSQLRTFIR